jgi:hypothetical protein
LGKSNIDLAPIRDSWRVGVEWQRGTVMKAFWKAPLAAAVASALMIGAAAAYTPPAPDKAVFDRTVEIVNEEFYRPAEIEAFNKTVGSILDEANGLEGADGAAVETAIDAALASLNTSQTARSTADEGA